MRELLRIHPDEHPVSVQLFGPDPEAMRSAASMVAEAGADLLDINMGCPVQEGPEDGRGRRAPGRPRARARGGARRRPRARACRSRSSSARAFGPATARATSWRSGSPPRRASRRSASIRARRPSTTRAVPTTPSPPSSWPSSAAASSTARWSSPAASGDAAKARHAYEASNADAVMVARGGMGNPWIFEELTGVSRGDSRRERGRRASCAGCSIARPSTGARSAPRATCASSIRGTWSASTCTARRRTSSSARPICNRVRELLEDVETAVSSPV